MNVIFQISEPLLQTIHEDLSRPHEFALERVGFITCHSHLDAEGNITIVTRAYHPIRDSHYIDDPHYGALMGADAIRKALELSYNQKASIVHIHRHEHRGRPQFSRTDIIESNKFMPNFHNVSPSLPHAAIVLSYNSMAGRCWPESKKPPVPIRKFIITRPSRPTGVFA